VQKGLAIPSPSQFGNQRYQERLKEDSEFKKKEEELAELCKKAKEQYGYKYASP
jgi:glutathione S-transferase